MFRNLPQNKCRVLIEQPWYTNVKENQKINQQYSYHFSQHISYCQLNKNYFYVKLKAMVSLSDFSLYVRATNYRIIFSPQYSTQNLLAAQSYFKSAISNRFLNS